MRRVVILHPPSPFLLDDKALAPLGAITVATVLNRTGQFEARVVDLAGEKDFVNVALAKLEAEDWDAVGVSTTTQQTSRVTPIVRAIREAYGYGDDAHLVAGGPGPTNDPQRYLRMGFDTVVRNEGEYAFHAWAPGPEQVITTPLLPDLDVLPFADRDLVDIHAYTFKVRDRDGKPLPSTHIMGTRGCPFGCDFCSGRGQEYYRRYRAFSPQRIVDELEFVRSRWGFTAFMDYADEINIDRRWLLEYCRLMEGRGFVMRSFAVARLLDEDIVSALARAGWTEICIGVESGDDDLLRRNHIHKTTYATSLRAVRLLQAHGIRCKAFTMVGLPGETRETARMTKQWLLEAQPDDFDVTIQTPFPGSPIYEHPEEYAWGIDFEPIDFTSEELGFYKSVPGEYKAYVRTPELSPEDLVALREEIDVDVRRALGLPLVARPVEHSMGQGP